MFHGAGTAVVSAGRRGAEPLSGIRDHLPRPMPRLIVKTGGLRRTFSPGHDVVIGNDPRADVRVVHPLVSKAHVVLRFAHGRWVAIDNGSLNGMFVDCQ